MTHTSGGENFNYYKLPLEQAEYNRIFKTDGFNWSTGYICGAQIGGRKSPEDLPDIPFPVE